MAKGKIKVQTENIFPIIKKFLYSDHEIFLRELISNAVDATLKLKTLSSIGEAKGETGDVTIEIEVDKEKKEIIVRDRGVGMSEEEVKKYINQIAFSGAEEFVEKYKDKTDGTNIIGHFGLGFYSSFMVADMVKIRSKSHRSEESAIEWQCNGSPEFQLKNIDKEERGTEIVLHVADDSTEFLEENRIQELLSKYCKFMPVPIKFGTKDEYKTVPTGEKDEEGKEKTKEEKYTVDNLINNPEPAWVKAPSKLEEEDYKGFYKELYPLNFEDPLFHIHLNVDYPFNLTGILYFPKLKNTMELPKDRIQLYCNQVFVTDSVEGIVPDFLTLLRGVIDSPDIPLNVSRSYLQADGNVKKISNHITKKVADKLNELFNNDREEFEKKWDDIKVFIEYGMLSEEKFYDKANKFALYKDTEGNYYTIDELTEEVKKNQTNKDGQLIYLYTNDVTDQHAYIEEAKEKGYKVLIMDTALSGHLVQHLEQKLEKSSFARVDGDTIDNLIKKDEEIPSKLSEEEQKTLQPIFESIVPKEKFSVQFESLSETSNPVAITRSEFMRRMQEMNKVGGGGMMMGDLPETYNLVVNSNHPLIGKILSEKSEEKQKALTKQATDLALLSQNLLKGEELTQFIKRSINLIN